MKEYTMLALLGALLTVALDVLLRTRLMRQRRFWIFWVVMGMLMFIVNGYLTWRPIVMYGNEFFLAIRLFTIPLEDFAFGFSLISSNIILWEYFTKRFRIPEAPEKSEQINS